MYLMKAGTMESEGKREIIWDTRGCMTIEEAKMKIDVAGLAPATQLLLPSSLRWLPEFSGSILRAALYATDRRG